MTTSRYAVDIDPAQANTSHAIMLSLVGGGKRVLDVGCAEGDLARALRQRGCTVSGVEFDAAAAEVARPDLEELVVGDLGTLDLTQELAGAQFDVLVFGDVLEHLVDPLRTLRQARALLAPGGYVVISVPNIAHASVRLALLKGEFRYRELGLLDQTHVRFFTRATLLELLAHAGLAAAEVRRTTAGPFETELQVRETDVAPEVVAQVLQDPDATTYQFVLSAVPDDADARVLGAVERADRLEADLARVTQQLEAARAEVDAVRLAGEEAAAAARTTAHQEAERAAQDRVERAERVAALRSRRISELEADLAEVRAHAVAARQELESQSAARAAAEARIAAMEGSTSWRVSAPVRALGPARAALQGPVGSRTSLRSAGGLRAVAAKVREKGVHGTVESVRRALAAPGQQASYLEWVAANDTLDDADRAAVRRHLALLPHRPALSVLMPVYETDPGTLRAALDSLSQQLYQDWELCAVDDHSPDERAWQVLQEHAARDPRFRVVRRAENGGIAAATNTALELATGEHVVLMDHDDVLPEHALYMVALELVKHPDTDLLYSDEDKLDAEGRRADPYFKPDFNHELLLGQNCISHLGVVRTSLLREIGGLQVGVEGSQDHDLVLRVVERTTPDRVRHVPFVLYHWRQWSGSGTFSSANLDKAAQASRAAVQAHLDRLGEDAVVEPNPVVPSWNRVRFALPAQLPEVTVVVPTRDRAGLLRECLDGVLGRTDYPALKVLVVDNDSQEQETLDYFDELRRDPRVHVLTVPGPFNFSDLNNRAVAQVDTPLVLLLNNDIVVRHADWLREMVSLVRRPGVGAVGAKLLYADGRVQHGGVLLGIGGVANHAHLFYDGRSPGYFGRLALLQEVSAVTGACLLTHTDAYREVGGLDDVNLAVAFNDVDFCLRLREAGWRILWTPHAELFHLESVSRGLDERPEQAARFQREIAWMQSRWGGALQRDPAYNPNLSDVLPDFSLAPRPRVDKPWSLYRR